MTLNQTKLSQRFSGGSSMRKFRQFASLLASGVVFSAALVGCGGTASQKAAADEEAAPVFPIKVSSNHHYFVDQKGHPFFWLGDTGWLLLSKLSGQEVDQYLDDRAAKGMNVIQVMVIHDLAEKNVFGRTALVDKNLGQPDTATVASGDTLNYWQGLDSAVIKAEKRNMIVALVPVWGSVVKSGKVSRDQAEAFGKFLAARYHDAKNVIWFNGGDINGSDSTAIWERLGSTIKAASPDQLMSFHPLGRTQSSKWFHDASWLDFNAFQSGHKDYRQDTAQSSLRYAEDNYKYVQTDFVKQPIKPTLDAEPSYEGIPHGLHDSLEVRWDAAAIRRYGYWSVFAGGAGFTYGANAIMQFYDPTKGVGGAYGVTKGWEEALKDTAAGQMIHLKALMQTLSTTQYLDRVPDSSSVVDQGTKYDYIAATKGPGYMMFYTFNGRPFKVSLKYLQEGAGELQATWYDPRTGESQPAVNLEAKDSYEATPPGGKSYGNDWVLILKKQS